MRRRWIALALFAAVVGPGPAMLRAGGQDKETAKACPPILPARASARPHVEGRRDRGPYQPSAREATRAMARTSRVHFDSSAANCFRPAAVSR
jgi:hypothetical protein